MKKNFKRCLTFAMTVAMVASNIPTIALQAEEVQKAGWNDDYSAYYFETETGDLERVESTSTSTDATCVEYASITYTAEFDGDVETKTIYDEDAGYADHTASEAKEENKVDPTCTEEGSFDTVVYCSVCDAEISRDTTKVDALGHKEADPVKENEVEATCTEEGSYDEVVYCSVCGDKLSSETKTVEKADHDYVKDTKTSKKATCTEDGLNVYVCSACGDVKEEVTTKAHKKSEAVEENKVDPTCTEKGSYDAVVYCSVCGTEISRTTVEIPATGHNYVVDEEASTPATCTATGTEVSVCSVCGDTVKKEIPMTDHTPGEAVQLRDETFVDATCTAEGQKVMAQFCTECGAEIEGTRETVVIPMKDHTYVEDEAATIPATCTKAGKKALVCSECGATTTEKIAKLAHDYTSVKENIVEATCTEEGSYDEVSTCTVCGYVKTSKAVKVAALGHDYVEDEDAYVAPTCTEAGEKVSICSRCEDQKTEEIEALGHDYVAIEGAEIPATCEEDGKKYEKCSRCGDIRITPIPATGHTEAEAVQENVKDPTCTKRGSYDEVVYCTNCNKELSRKTKRIAALGHDYVEDTEKTVAATCTEDGTKALKCTRCDATDTETIPATGHDFDEIIIKAATCTEDGESFASCKNCDYKETEHVVPALGHDYEVTAAKIEWSLEDPAKCYVTTTKTCKNDAAHVITTTELAEAEGEVTTEPGCTKVGEMTYTYTVETVNGDVTSTNVAAIDPTGHGDAKLVKKNVVEPTCTEDGSYDSVEYCSVCGEKLRTVGTVVIKATGHTAGEAEIEVKQEGTDVLDYIYDTVVKCSECGEELSRETTTVPATGHKPGKPVVEEGKAATCTEDGNYYVVVKCTEDDTELSREEYVIPATGHTWEVKEEYVRPNCSTDGLYKYTETCSTCGTVNEETSYEEVLPKEDHSAFYTKTVAKDATCTEAGSTCDVTYCGICFEEVSRSAETVIPAKGHEEVTVKENEKAATCTEAGSYDETVYCAVCGEELSHETKVVAATGHEAAKAVIENLVEATTTTNRNYDSVVRCSKCKAIISSKHIVIEKEKNPLSVCTRKCNNKTLKAKNLKKKAVSFTIHTYRSDKAKLTYKKLSGSKKITVSKSGVLKVKKGTKKGTYRVKIRVNSAQTKLYKAATTTYIITIKVK